ncbi:MULTISPECIES: phenylalanine--tRNA ligase subunit alpha [Methanoculleus]|uniref:Phenylalanine--tRNA ligase alpha subunit n=2 Tax=Methanoculleus TaxID=45989 RepID=SYFA_METMJ|nr:MULTISPECIES: phenylalanine--tRNA ligase subunit alpha [Methanoculleus]A3CT76.1 RecName: Full=Phenylalanine--tRNA ligase alpha subunit; AltName: Full=Phenylalanyl-tRNA synthetase alpha subunit; Short=PheRS [Methanoculleus marisnigri JR1]ABN56576.1 phenylalanyl-tRNA synthetase, alpha subunit [Methanoculleus marisnigri JR1]UYU18014.1 phenylalanine--tRNA ligase subunit alpha [Methanoculleus submarinus]
MELTLNEKRLLVALGPMGSADAAVLAEKMDTRREAVVQYANLAGDRGLVDVEKHVARRYVPTEEGRAYMGKGLPERQVLESFEESIPMRDLQGHPLAKIAIGWMRKKGWIAITGGVVQKTGKTAPGPDEAAFVRLAEKGEIADGEGVADLAKRGLAIEEETVAYTVSITPRGRELLSQGLDLREEAGTLTREQILSGEWKSLPLRRYDVTKLPKRAYPGKVHPYQRIIDEMRRILFDMGFEEMSGGIVQSSFWNFDALFQPQDHPAREMQDTFFLGERRPLPAGYERVRDMHEHGGETSSTGWGGTWSAEKAEQCVLRTHTTSLSIQHLAAHPKPPVKAFCIGRVYRREAIDPTHLAEFEQLEGIVMDEDVNLRHLLGFLKEFYAKMGFEKVRFRPGYFPYTEPSVEPEVYVDGLGWVELGGSGIFRQEVTAPFGIEHPVLAWGLGISRVAMLRLGLRDLRHLYRSDIEWIRETPVYGGRR